MRLRTGAKPAVGGQLTQLHELQPPTFPPPLQNGTLPRKNTVSQSGQRSEKAKRSLSPIKASRRSRPGQHRFRRHRYARPLSKDCASSSSCESDMQVSPSKSMEDIGSTSSRSLRFKRYLPGNTLGGQVADKPTDLFKTIKFPESHSKRFPALGKAKLREPSYDEEGTSTDDIYGKPLPKNRCTRLVFNEELAISSDDSSMPHLDHARSKSKFGKSSRSLHFSQPSFQQCVVAGARATSSIATRNLKQRLKAFDRRYAHSCRNARARRKRGGEQSDVDGLSNESGSVDGDDEKTKRAEDRRKVDSSFEQALHFMDRSVLKERPLQFAIVQSSSYRGEFPPTELTRERGKWETSPLHVRNEYVIVELKQGPGTVTGVSFGLPGNESAPRYGRIFYSNLSIEGPWSEAWKFETRSKDAYAFKTTHDHNRLADEFRDLLEKQCGGISEAWRNILDVNTDGALSFTEFTSACTRLRQLPSVKKARRVSVFEDQQRLFESIDVDASGTVRLEDLLQKGGKVPIASWWKLLFSSNWGSTVHMCVCAPLRIYTSVSETEEGLGLDDDLLPCKPTYDLSRAFDLKTLDVSDHQIMLRQLAQKHDMPVNALEEIYRRFCEVDSDHSGVIEKDEFQMLVLKLHGARDSMDVPRSRLKFFWQEADRDGSGEIDFDEFLEWFWNYFSKESAASFKKNHVLVENYYSSVAWPRGDSHRRHSLIHCEDGGNTKVSLKGKSERKSVVKLFPETDTSPRSNKSKY